MCPKSSYLGFANYAKRLLPQSLQKLLFLCQQSKKKVVKLFSMQQTKNKQQPENEKCLKRLKNKVIWKGKKLLKAA